MDREAVNELLYQMLETELVGEKIYETAIENATNKDLRQEWHGYLDETRTHQDLVREIMSVAGLDPESETAGRRIVRMKGQALVDAMIEAREDGKDTAQLVAAECVVEAEAKDHQNWELLSQLAAELDDDLGQAMQDAYDEAGDQEAEHFFHTKGWARELWMEFLGLPAALPPPEEEKSVTTEIGAGRAEHEREQYV